MPSLALEQLLHVLVLTDEVIDEILAEPLPGSYREAERAAVLVDKMYGSGRVALLDELNVDLRIGAANVALIVGDLADCLQAASLRDNRVNKPAVSIMGLPRDEVTG